MKRNLVLAATILAVMVAPVAASDKDKDNDDRVVRTRLTGYQETSQTINTPASGEFRATISEDGTAIHYELTWRDLSAGVTQSHIHFGRPALTGSIVLWLCTAGPTPPPGTPTPQACPPTNPATITGTLTAADVVPSTAQGIDPGAAGFAETVKAIRVGAAYVNVHTTAHPSGEIRGRLGHRERDDHHDGDEHHHH